MLAGRRALACLFAFVTILGAPGRASAAPALRAPVPGRFLLGFGETYGSRVHAGLDIAAEPGSEVAAPAAGTVTFAGRLPAEGDVLAVTITTPDGFKVTCLPLVSAAVAKGAVVEAGRAIGVSAAEGDVSSAETHVHVSVRQGETYLDPAPLIPAPPAPPEPAPAADGVSAETAPGPAGSPRSGSAPVAAPVAHPVAAPAPAVAVAGNSASPAPASPAAVVGVPAAAGAEVRAVAVRGSQPLASPAAVAHALSTCTRTLRTAAPVPRPRPVAPVSHAAALEEALRTYGRLRELAGAVAALLVAGACLWPVWRRMPVPAAPGEMEPVRVRA